MFVKSNIILLSPHYSLHSVSSEGHVEVVGSGTLQISNIAEEDAGIYTCIAENPNSTIEAQAQLTVQGNFVHLLHLLLFL